MLEGLTANAPAAIPLHAVRPEGLPGLLEAIPAAAAAFLRATGFFRRFR